MLERTKGSVYPKHCCVTVCVLHVMYSKFVSEDVFGIKFVVYEETSTLEMNICMDDGLLPEASSTANSLADFSRVVIYKESTDRNF
jgi:hypothetical protein